MKNILISFITLISALLLPQLNQAQAPDFLWAHGMGNSGHEEAQLVAADPSGNIVVAGFLKVWWILIRERPALL
ncbi:MAG: hypothetical protein IPP71_08070 [Bacteroidetes bacterium]|nr:hypothetical protein [Bacteroidota bacterium]